MSDRPRRWTRYGPHARVIPDDWDRPGIPPQPAESLDGMYGPGRDGHSRWPVESSPIPATVADLLRLIDEARPKG